MASVGWLADASEESLRSALAEAMPELAGLEMQISAPLPSSNPLWWSSSAVIDDAVVVKFAWPEVRAVRLWREGVILQRLRKTAPSLAVPDIVAVTGHPVLVATRLVQGVRLGGEWAWELSEGAAVVVGEQLGAFLSDLHGVHIEGILDGLPTVIPAAQADTSRLRHRFPRLVDDARARRYSDGASGSTASSGPAGPPGTRFWCLAQMLRRGGPDEQVLQCHRALQRCRYRTAPSVTPSAPCPSIGARIIERERSRKDCGLVSPGTTVTRPHAARYAYSLGPASGSSPTAISSG